MKLLPISFSLLGSLIPLIAQEPPPKWDVSIPEAIPDGTPSPPVEKAEPIDFTVLSSRTTRMDVSESPEMPELPPINGNVRVTVELVSDPGLPDPPPPLPALEPDDPAVIARLAELREIYRGTELLFLSASVYDGSRTLLTIYPNGNVGNKITAWSNLNFNHFSGFATYRVKDGVDGSLHDFGLLMGIGNMETAKMQRFAAKAGRDYEAPEIPEMPELSVGGPAFVIVEGESDSPAMDTLEQLHDLYRKEGERMAAASEARQKAYEERKAYLLANPPTPQDVTLRFWKKTPAAPATEKGDGQ